jgi:hypothetical protein
LNEEGWYQLFSHLDHSGPASPGEGSSSSPASARYDVGCLTTSGGREEEMEKRIWVVLSAVTIACVVPTTRLLAQSGEQPRTEASELADELKSLKDEFQSIRQSYEARFAELESRLSALEVGAPAVAEAAPAASAPAQPTAPVPEGASGAGGPSGALPFYGGSAATSKVFNPDIAVIGDFLGAAGNNSVNPTPALELHESEASFQAIVDPYARADFFISFGQEGVEVEEGYVSFPAVPGGFLLKAGKTRAAFGKVNTLHNHVLPWTDRPLVTENLVGGEEGISDAGFSVARLIPNPWIFLEAVGQVYRGDSPGIFESSKRSDLSYVGHLRGYQDVTESSNLDVGFSYAYGHNDVGSDFTTDIYGTDFTFRYRPLRRAIYHSFIARSELIWSRREQLDGRRDAFGYYVSGDYQFARRWFAGARYDNSERSYDETLRDEGYSLLLTWWPSEFSQIRGQFRRTDYAEGESANEFLFQFQFSIGAHGAHPF